MVLVTVAAGAPWLLAQDAARFFRIATGGVAGTYYPVGGLIADVISNPPGTRPCDRGGSCGVPGMIAVVQTSSGSVSNVEAIAAGAVETAFAQADIAYWAYAGKEVFNGAPAFDNLRAMTRLYTEAVHIVARADAEIDSISDLIGKRVSLDEVGSGTLADARLILAAHGIDEGLLITFNVKPNQAVSMMRKGELDAFFTIAGYPTGAVSELAYDLPISLVPLEDTKVAELRRAYPFFVADEIPAETYPGVAATPTVAVAALWLTGAEQPADEIEAVLEALYDPRNRERLDSGHPVGRQIVLEHALDGISVPLHPGAERFFELRDMLPLEPGVPLEAADPQDGAVPADVTPDAGDSGPVTGDERAAQADEPAPASSR